LARWRTLTVDMIDSYLDLKDDLDKGRNSIISKRNGAIYYDRVLLYTRAIRSFIYSDLKI